MYDTDAERAFNAILNPKPCPGCPELTCLKSENARLLEHNRILLAQSAAGQNKPEAIKVSQGNAGGSMGLA